MGWWTRGPIIGRGSSATVSLATDSSGELLAVKSAELSSSSLLQKEEGFISQLRSPYVVQHLGSEITTENNKPVYNLLMEYLPGGTLSDQIKRQGGSLPEPVIRNYAFQILRGLDYIHSKGIVHCDIKGQNVLIGRDWAKIGDFGCAKKAEEENGFAGKSRIVAGTPLFMAPEVARGEEQGFPADVWAVGCVIVEMATGNNPWPDVNDSVSALYKIGHSGDSPEFPGWLSDCGKEFLSKCLNQDAKDRWTANQLLQHPFLDGVEREQEMEFVRSSPTSVLDHGFWDSMEVSEYSEYSSSNVVVFPPLSSLANRVRSLIGDLDSFGSNLPNWRDDEEDWITVRGMETEEIPQTSQQNQQDSIQDSELVLEPLLFSNVSQESVDRLLSDSLDDDISDTRSVSNGTNVALSSSISFRDDFECVLGIPNLESEINENLSNDHCRIFSSSSLFLLLYFEHILLPVNLINSCGKFLLQKTFKLIISNTYLFFGACLPN